jgi:uncharacterized membrane protein
MPLCLIPIMALMEFVRIRIFGGKVVDGIEAKRKEYITIFSGIYLMRDEIGNVRIFNYFVSSMIIYFPFYFVITQIVSLFFQPFDNPQLETQSIMSSMIYSFSLSFIYIMTTWIRRK